MTQPQSAEAQRERRVEQALAELDLTGKAHLLGGASAWSIAPNPDIGLSRLVMSDGPVGVRGERWSSDDPSVQLPSPTAMAATWDRELIRRGGHLLAQEARRKGAHVLLAPTVNLHRSPRGGRHFECYSEDPYLTGEIGTAYVAAVQEGGVATTVKHFVANDSETDRFTVDVQVDERTLRELYLAPFEAIVKNAQAWGIMAAYNSVNGPTMTEHAELNAVLRDEWGFDGFIVSDWTAARDTVGCALAGMDVAMPGPDTVYGDKLVAAVREGRVPEAAVTEMARRVLRLAARVGALDGVEPAVPAAALPAEVDSRQIAREMAARSCTLLRNENAALPIDASRVRKIALIGLAAQEARTSGGGSATVYAEHTVSPLEGLRAALPADVELTYAVGTDPTTTLPALEGPFTAVFRDADEQPLATEEIPTGAARWADGPPEGVDPSQVTSIEITTTHTPTVSGGHEFAISGAGHYRLTVAGETVHDGDQYPDGDDPGAAFLNPPETRRTVELTAGEPVTVSVRLTSPPAMGGFTFFGFTLGHSTPKRSEEEMIDEAVQAAADADVAIVIAATTAQVESEGFDRETLALPGRQDELVARVAEANARTIAVVNAGSPVLMPWREQVSAVLLSWFGGQEIGHALADVLLGTAEPGGRLPTTWPNREGDVPVLAVEPTDGALPYEEGIFIGYRAWERAAAPPAYWFGHGLGYTSWRYDGAAVAPADDPELATVQVRLTNTGERTGREVVQVYLGPVEPEPQRPVRWLAGFTTVDAVPGETAQVEVTLPRRAAETWDANARAWQLAPGEYRLHIGRSYADTPITAPLTVSTR
ncbi:beta-glucosidase H [Salinactinospora qingdaonensis]|uniref:Glycoside hydrolase family 3 C-terminal domain-containing protein n=1 Tax=Salinactinospora qingdaonensis TaxID=702744 RepID=A0ABP7GHP2_9ACTN